MAVSFRKFIFPFLKEKEEERLTARQIAEAYFERHPEECRKKQQQSKAQVIPLDTDSALINQLVAEIGSNRPILQKKHPEIKTTESRPRKYYFSRQTDLAEIAGLTESAKEDLAKSPKTTYEQIVGEPPSSAPDRAVPILEKDLYPKLSIYLRSELSVYSKRIDESRSTNRHGSGGNKWLHPDLVGMEDLSQDWDEEVKKCVGQYADKKAKLWSFEVKRVINLSNVRESFFQAVSNSSWANFGYLVAGEIRGAAAVKELRLLSSLHGIGVIQMDADDPSESQIVIPAEEKSKIDWNAANRLARENRDFLNYVKHVRQFHQTGEVKSADWGSTELD